jgi:hypothetical protein
MRCAYCNDYCTPECEEEFYECHSCEVCNEKFGCTWGGSYSRTFTCKDLIIIKKHEGVFLSKRDSLSDRAGILIPNFEISKEIFKDKDKLHRKLMTYLTFT